ncbi:hypothetical protein [Kitasatospora cineracea]|uniref:hypothetical protein n=1 Tax=Kitasatospora cineracea TaxID=88074 RepID=UPI0036CF1DBE
MNNLPRLAAAPDNSLVVVHGVITTYHDRDPRTLTVSDESGSVSVTVTTNAVGGTVVNNGQAHLVGTRTTIVGLRLDATRVRASNIDLDTAPLTPTDADNILTTVSAGTALPAATLLALPAARTETTTAGTR